jgi:hypothetical protein
MVRQLRSRRYLMIDYPSRWQGVNSWHTTGTRYVQLAWIIRFSGVQRWMLAMMQETTNGINEIQR